MTGYHSLDYIIQQRYSILVQQCEKLCRLSEMSGHNGETPVARNHAASRNCGQYQ